MTETILIKVEPVYSVTAAYQVVGQCWYDYKTEKLKHYQRPLPGQFHDTNRLPHMLKLEALDLYDMDAEMKPSTSYKRNYPTPTH